MNLHFKGDGFTKKNTGEGWLSEYKTKKFKSFVSFWGKYRKEFLIFIYNSVPSNINYFSAL